MEYEPYVLKRPCKEHEAHYQPEPEINIDIYSPEVSTKTVRSMKERIRLDDMVLTTLCRYTTSRAHLYGGESHESECGRLDGMSYHKQGLRRERFGITI